MSRAIVILWLVAVLLFLSGGLEPASARSARTSRKFDEYGSVRSGDHAARLDNFAIQLQHETEAYGWVVVYAPESASKHIRESIAGYLMNTRGLGSRRVKTFHAGYNEVLTEPLVQLWIVPEGAAPPKPKKREVDLGAFKGKLAEYQAWDHIELVNDDGESHELGGDGPAVGNVIHAAFDDILKVQKNSIAHVIGLNGLEDIPGTWRRVAESTVENLKRLGFESSRFNIGYGGQSKETKVQLWILSKGENPPTKDPTAEPLPKKAIQFGDYDEFTLGDAKNEAAVLQRLQTVMRENPNLRVCFIVRMEVPHPVEEEPSEPIVIVPPELAAPSGPPEPEPVPADLFKLVEKWKNEIAAKNQNRQDRVVVLFGKAQEYFLASLEIWIVPPGQPLPDPNTPSEEVEKPLLTYYSKYSTLFEKRSVSSLPRLSLNPQSN
ncbi:MAG TPA: hypothetical protein VFS77_02950 [Pyrinomonadaceae bacterium]|nr:hypothetical protein [Pyrinomonadaceae bacterium]